MREEERNIDVRGSHRLSGSCRPPPGDPACPLSGNLTSNHLARQTTPKQLNHANQGPLWILNRPAFRRFGTCPLTSPPGPSFPRASVPIISISTARESAITEQGLERSHQDCGEVEFSSGRAYGGKPRGSTPWETWGKGQGRAAQL